MSNVIAILTYNCQFRLESSMAGMVTARHRPRAQSKCCYSSSYELKLCYFPILQLLQQG